MWSSRLVPGNAPDGSPLLSVLAKRTYRFAPGQAALPDDQEPIPFVEADRYLDPGDPATCPTLEESDLVAFKPNVDVIVHGKAWAPRGKRGRFFDLILNVAGTQRALRIFGDRRVRLKTFGFDFTDPEPFESMPLHWGLAYGGTDNLTNPDLPLSYPRNPLGRGFVVDPGTQGLHDLLLPNLEDPRDLLDPSRLLVKRFENWPKAPIPMALGWTSRHAQPRILQAGMEADTFASQQAARQRQLQASPEVGTPGSPPPAEPARLLNHQYHNGAPSFLQFAQLQGGAPVSLQYMDPDHPLLSFSLPDDAPTILLDVGEGSMRLPATLQTVEIFVPTRQITTVWRGSVQYPGPEWLAARPRIDWRAVAAKG